jgi:hypothetical protein
VLASVSKIVGVMAPSVSAVAASACRSMMHSYAFWDAVLVLVFTAGFVASGMNDKVGQLSFRMDREAFDKPYSNETAHMIDTEVGRSRWRWACLMIA